MYYLQSKQGSYTFGLWMDIMDEDSVVITTWKIRQDAHPIHKINSQLIIQV